MSSRRTVATILHAALLPVLALVAMLVGISHEAPVGGWVGTMASAEPTNVPAWSADLADRFPACRRHREGVLAPGLVVIDSAAGAHRMSTDAAFALNSDAEQANNVWVVGVCIG